MDAHVLIVGGGTAGAAAARACAKRGLRTLVVDRRSLDEAGARWVNGVPGYIFDDIGLERPKGPELAGGNGPFHVVAGWGPIRTTVPASGVLEVDMRHLVARLQGQAQGLGATLRGDVEVRGWRPEGTGAVVETNQGALRAQVVVDASGMAGARLLEQRPPPREYICAAAQQVHELADPQAARAFLARHQAADGEVLCFTGVAGGYSIVNVRVHAHSADPKVSVLTGSIPGLGHPGGQQLLDAFVADNPWIGARRFGGARAIPIDAPMATLSQGPVALLGDAGGQVFAAHGSGIGIQLLSAELLAEVLASGGSPWDYAVAWHRTYGGRLGATAVFAEFSRDLDLPALERLTASGVMGPTLVGAALAQKEPVPALSELPGMVGGAWRVRDILKDLAPVVARMARVQAHHGQYPRKPEGLPDWEQRRRRILKRSRATQ